jgi:hypothetical protein
MYNAMPWTVPGAAVAVPFLETGRAFSGQKHQRSSHGLLVETFYEHCV